MKKIIFGGLVAIALGVGAFVVSQNCSSINLSDVQLANVEALASFNEESSLIPCKSEAKRNYNYTYVNCATCEKEEGWKGIGTQGTCRPR